MLILGTEVNYKCFVAFAAGSLFGGGFVYVAYKLLTRRPKSGHHSNSLHDVNCEADLMLPVMLESEYGNCRQTCFSSDETASAFLNQIPEQFFQFQEQFAQLIATSVEKRKCTRALVIGSKTGALAFNLSKLFTQVKGVERSFSQVASCYRLQNLEKLEYYFPLEGSLKTSYRTITSPFLSGAIVNKSKSKRSKGKVKEHERLEFVNCDPSFLPDYIGSFELVIVNNCLNDINDPEKFLSKLEKFVESNGVLIVTSDYNWKRDTNLATGFGNLPVTDTFGLLRHYLKGHFAFVNESCIPEAYCVSNRTCIISNQHVTVWTRNDIQNAVAS